MGPPGVVQPERGTANQAPPARRGQGVHACLFPGNSHRARRNLEPGGLQPGGGDAAVHPAQLGEARGEAQHIDAIDPLAVDADDVLLLQAGVLGDKGEVRTLPAPV